MIKVLVTGANGYLGNVLESRIDAELYSVTKIDLGVFKHHTFEYKKLDLSKDFLAISSINLLT